MANTTMSEQDTEAAIEEFLASSEVRIGETKKVGVKRDTHRDYILAFRDVTVDLIRIFALANGEMNPLFRDPEYAAKTPWGGIIAPPLMIETISSAVAIPPMPDVPGWGMMAAGNHYIMERPLRPGDHIEAEDVWQGITERTREDRPHRTFILNADRKFFDQYGNYVGVQKCGVFATCPKPGAERKERPKSAARKRPRYSDEKLKEIYDHYDAEAAGTLRRGAEPRFWEDVREGDDLGLVIKGPYDALDLAGFVGAVGASLGFADKWKLIKDELAQSPIDPETGAYHYNMTWHLDDRVAQAMGQPLAMNFGNLVEINMSHLVTNWMGDLGFAGEFETRFAAPTYTGDTVWITGKVEKVWEEDGKGMVELQLVAHQQDDVPVARQRVVAQLPHKGKPTEVVDRFRA